MLKFQEKVIMPLGEVSLGGKDRHLNGPIPETISLCYACSGGVLSDKDIKAVIDDLG